MRVYCFEPVEFPFRRIVYSRPAIVIQIVLVVRVSFIVYVAKPWNHKLPFGPLQGRKVERFIFHISILIFIESLPTGLANRIWQFNCE